MITGRRMTTNLLLTLLAAASTANARAGTSAAEPEIGVGPQYDTTHVYIKAADFDHFVGSFTATLGGKPSPRIPSVLTPTPSKAEFQYVWTPAGTLSTFAFSTPIPYPFGLERTGWLVTDLDRALKLARDNGAEVIVEKWPDPIGYDAIIQWPGGVKMQLYWHFNTPHYEPLEAIPETRVYLTRDLGDTFLHSILGFSQGRIVSDDRTADGAELGKPGETFRRVRLESSFGKMQVNVTDGHLPYPFGYEITGYEVKDLDAALAKATAHGVATLSPRFDGADRSSIIVEFPGGYIAELHQIRPRQVAITNRHDDN